MPLETFRPMFALAIASDWTPGPNNALLAASGARFGLRLTVPHIIGVGFGLPLMVFIVGLFLGQAFQQSVALQQGLRWGGAALLLWMGWKIANSGAVVQAKGRGRPFTLLGAAAFQWVNPKGRVMSISITSLYLSSTEPATTAAIIAATFILMGVTSALGWAWVGQAIAGWLGTGARLRYFNITLGAMVAAGTAVLIFG